MLAVRRAAQISRSAFIAGTLHGQSLPVDRRRHLGRPEVPEITAKLLAWRPEERLVPGHADDCDMAQARRFLDMLQKTGDIVRAEVAKGKHLARLQADGPASHPSRKSTPAFAWIASVSNNGTSESSCLSSRGISVHPSTTAWAPRARSWWTMSTSAARVSGLKWP